MTKNNNSENSIKESGNGNTEGAHIQTMRRKIIEIYDSNEPITENAIIEIRNELEKIPNLVINFDDTITKPPVPNPEFPERGTSNYSIRAILDKVEELKPEKKELTTRFRNFFDGKEKPSDYNIKNIIDYFYSKVLEGLTEKEIGNIYDQIVDVDESIDKYDAISPNYQFAEACRLISKVTGDKKIRVFVLSLNTPDLIKRWHTKNLPKINEVLKNEEIEIEVVGIMGNKIKYDSEGRIVGVVEHVTDANKSKYIPEGTIMLADDRETEKLARLDEKENEDDRIFVNVVNIEGKNFDEAILRISANIYELLKLIKQKPNKKETDELFVECVKYKKLAVIANEQYRKDIEERVNPQTRTKAIINDAELDKMKDGLILKANSAIIKLIKLLTSEGV